MAGKKKSHFLSINSKIFFHTKLVNTYCISKILHTTYRNGTRVQTVHLQVGAVYSWWRHILLMLQLLLIF